MLKEERTPLLRYGVSLISVAIATLIRLLLSSVVGDGVPFIFFFPAVAASAWFGGLGPGLFSTGLSALVAWFLFIPSLHLLSFGPWSAPVRLSAFLLAGLFISGLAEITRRAYKRAVASGRGEREERERLRVTLASIGDAVIATDIAGRVTLLNGVAEALTGWRQAEVLGKELNEVFSVINEKTRERVESPLTRVLRDGAIVGLANHSVLIAKDGTERPIADSGAPIKDDSGKIIGAVLVFRDITGSREAEVTTLRLAAIVESSDDAIIGKTLDGVITSWNRAAERIFGYAAAEAIGQPIHIIIPPDRREEEDRILRQLRNEGHIEHYETLRQKKDGTLIDVSLAISPIKDGQGHLIGASKIARDITERKRLEQSLRTSEERLRLSHQVTGVGAWEWNGVTNEVFWSPEYREIYGLGAEEEPSFEKGMAVVVEEDREGIHRAISQALESGEEFTSEHRIRHPQKGLRWVQATGRTVNDKRQTVARMIGLVRDVTERKQAEQELREGAERLRLALEAAELGDWSWEATSSVVTLSARAAKILGVPGTQMPWAQMRTLLHHEDHGPAGQAVRQAFSTDSHFDIEYRVLRPGEGPTWVAAKGQAIYDETGVMKGIRGVVQDITERKQAEETRRLNEERLHLALESSALGMWSVELPENQMTNTPRNLEIFGFPPDGARPSPEEIITRLHSEDVSRVIEAWNRCAERGEKFDIEYRVLHPEGRVRWVASKGKSFADGAGRPTKFIGISADITDQKQAELLLREEEERHRLALEAGQIGTWDWDVVGNHVVWSDLIYKFHGLKPGEFSGRIEDFGAMVHPDDRERVNAAINDALENRAPYSIEVRVVWPNGEVHWIATKGKVFFDAAGKPIRMIGATLEITERRWAEERQRLLWEAAGVLLTSDDPDAMLRGIFSQVCLQLSLDTYFNFMVEEGGDTLRLKSYAGISAEEAEKIGRLEFGQAACGNVSLGRAPIAANSIQESDDPVVQIVKGYGIRAYACNPLLAGGRLIGTLSFASRSKEFFSEVEFEFFETISRYVTAAYERLRLIERLREADKRKDEFLAMLAHELRNPLAPVRNAVGLLKHYGANDPRLQWPREVIDRQVTHMTRLVDDLLDVSRITRGKIELRQEIVEMRTVVERALETSRPLVDAKGQRLTVELPAEPLLVKADVTRMAQVLSNLVSNAAKYTDVGGNVRLLVERNGSEVIARVRDNGVGIPADILSHIFELFAQAERSLDRSQGGLGIGLTVVKALTEMHGGRVEAYSEGPNKGSEFTVRLPAFTETLPEEVTAAAAAQQTAPGCRILVVDDNIDSAESMAMLLQFEGHEVKTAFDGLEALQATREFRPNVVLLDIGLPGMDGYEVARELRRDGEQQRLVLIALTGYGQAEDRQRSQDAGFDHHFTKPVDHDSLNSLIKSLKVE
jgi:PAS domain S-box-containing protein